MKSLLYVVPENLYVNLYILKTIWIRLLQRTWKKTYAHRKQVIQKRCTPHAIKEHERTGMWPSDCRYLPGLRGMMATC